METTVDAGRLLAQFAVRRGQALLHFALGDGEEWQRRSALRFVGLLHLVDDLLSHRRAEVRTR
jgi:hypothetical protein